MKTNTLAIIVTILGALGGAAAFATYLEGRRERALKEKVLNLDMQLKQLELSKISGNVSMM